MRFFFGISSRAIRKFRSEPVGIGRRNPPACALSLLLKAARGRPLIFVKRVQNGLDESSQKFRQLECVKFHRSPSPSCSCLHPYCMFVVICPCISATKKRLHENPASCNPLYAREASPMPIRQGFYGYPPSPSGGRLVQTQHCRRPEHRPLLQLRAELSRPRCHHRLQLANF